MWERDEPSSAAAPSADDEAGGAAGTAGGARDSVQVVVTDVVDANTFCVQLAEEPRVEWVAEQLAGLGLDEAQPPPVRGSWVFLGTRGCAVGEVFEARPS